jgi:hypothetical protein
LLINLSVMPIVFFLYPPAVSISQPNSYSQHDALWEYDNTHLSATRWEYDALSTCWGSYSQRVALNNNQLKAAVENAVTMAAAEVTVAAVTKLTSVAATTTAMTTATATVMVTMTEVMVTVATTAALATVASTTATGAEKKQSAKSCSRKNGDGSQCGPLPTLLASWAVQQASKARLRVSYSQRMLRVSYSQHHPLKVWYSQRRQLRVSYFQCALRDILSAGSAKQQSAKSCTEKCGNDGGSRGNSGGGKGFDVSSDNDDCSDKSNGNNDIDSDSGNGDHAEIIMLTVGGTESIIFSAPSFKP